MMISSPNVFGVGCQHIDGGRGWERRKVVREVRIIGLEEVAPGVPKAMPLLGSCFHDAISPCGCSSKEKSLDFRASVGRNSVQDLFCGGGKWAVKAVRKEAGLGSWFRDA